MAITLDGTNGVTTPDLTVDTSTLKVDAANNRVGVGTASPSQKLSILTSNGLLNVANGNTSNGTKIQSFVTAGNANGYLAFEGFDKEYARLDADGLKFNGDTAAVNALDDYEEGTFTPTLYHSSTNNSTFSYVNGEYTKIGNTVTCQLRIDGGNSGTAGSFLVIGGLPFTVSQAQGNMGIGVWGSNPSQQGGIVHGNNPPRLFKGGQDVTTQMSFFTAMLVYKTS